MKTDTQLKQDVNAELQWEPSIDAARIGVEVTDGIVTLSGRVASFAEKWNAERAAERVSGVRALTVSLDVELEGSSARNDVDIARAADNMLQWTTSLPKDQVKIMVEGGWLTLTGKVDWEFQREAAAAAVRNLIGVRGITNSLTIDSTVAASSVKSDIEAALKRRAATDARKISVTVRDANVTLSGTVGSWSERELATHSAWGTSGVRSVVDDMTLAS